MHDAGRQQVPAPHRHQLHEQSGRHRQASRYLHLCARAPRRNLRVVDYAGRFIAVSLYYAGRFTAVLLLLCCWWILLLYYCFTKRRAICILCARARDETCASWTMQVLSLPALLVQMYSVYLLYWYKGIQFTCWNLRGVGYTAAH